jgi:ribonuclease-3
MDPARSHEGPLEELAGQLGIVPRDPDLVRQAFVHSSYFNENPTAVAGHNERLEFYGDAVIGLTVSRLLFERYPDEDEGFLTARRAALVNRDALATMAIDIGLDRYLLLGRGEAEGGGATRPSVLAACMEALAGALSLSEGPERTHGILTRLFAPALDALAAVDGPPKSAKSRLQEWTQRHHGMKPVYQLTGTSGRPHEQEFRVEVMLDGRRLGGGSGSSRQRAEEQAASTALLSLDRADDVPAAETPASGPT